MEGGKGTGEERHAHRKNLKERQLNGFKEEENTSDSEYVHFKIYACSVPHFESNKAAAAMVCFKSQQVNLRSCVGRLNWDRGKG